MAGICENGDIWVKLLKSDNIYLDYPSYGLLSILETGTDGGIILATFKQKGSCPVVVRKPSFTYEGGMKDE